MNIPEILVANGTGAVLVSFLSKKVLTLMFHMLVTFTTMLLLHLLRLSILCVTVVHLLFQNYRKRLSLHLFLL